MIKKITMLLFLSCRSSPPAAPIEPTYPGMCADYYAQRQKEGNLLSQEGREGYWEKPEYIDCLASFGEKPYKL